MPPSAEAPDSDLNPERRRLVLRVGAVTLVIVTVVVLLIAFATDRLDMPLDIGSQRSGLSELDTANVNSTGRTILIHSSVTSLGKVLVLLLIGLALAVYPVFVILFADKHSQSDYVSGLLFVGAAFLVVAGFAGIMMRSWRFPLWLTAPAIVVLAAYSQKERQQIPYHLAVCAILVAATVVGGIVGSRLRASKRYAATDV